jgi:hypothetical protein
LQQEPNRPPAAKLTARHGVVQEQVRVLFWGLLEIHLQTWRQNPSSYFNNSISWTNGSDIPPQVPCLLLLQQEIRHQI